MCHSFSQLDLRADSAVASAADEVLRLTYAMIITHTHTQSHGHQGVKLMGVVHKRVKGLAIKNQKFPKFALVYLARQ